MRPRKLAFISPSCGTSTAVEEHVWMGDCGQVFMQLANASDPGGPPRMIDLMAGGCGTGAVSPAEVFRRFTGRSPGPSDYVTSPTGGGTNGASGE